MRALGFSLILLATPLFPAAAQHWKAPGELTRLNWGSVYVLVSADTTRGVQVSAITSHFNYIGNSESYLGWFDPVQVAPWLAKAIAVVKYDGMPASDSARALETPALGSNDGGGLIMRRVRRLSTWDRKVALIFASSRGKGWAVSAQRDEALAFLQALSVEAEKSRLVPAPADTASGLVMPLDLDEAPSRLDGPPLLWPATHSGEAGKSGEVLLQYIIGVNGRAESNSFEAIWFDDARFVDAAVRTVAESRFSPGKVNGQPVRTVVRQFVFFKTR